VKSFGDCPARGTVKEALMLSEQMQHIIAQACVTVISHDGRGQGVLVAGGLVLTAAHCVAFTTDGTMVLGDYFIHELQTTHGPLKVQPVAVEPVADMAALGALDGQEFPEETEAFEAWCTHTPPVPVCLEPLPLLDPFPIYIYTHRGTWIQGSAQLPHEDAHQLWIEVAAQIEGGTSGSPIVTARGELVGIVSHSTFSEDRVSCVGLTPRPHLTLPGWVMHRILAEQTP
jgi:Trypsin-like peptidase domain